MAGVAWVGVAAHVLAHPLDGAGGGGDAGAVAGLDVLDFDVLGLEAASPADDEQAVVSIRWSCQGGIRGGGGFEAAGHMKRR